MFRWVRHPPIRKNHFIKMTYQELLQSTEWQKKRKSIIERDNNTCTICDNNEILNSALLVYFFENDNKSYKLELNHFEDSTDLNITKINYKKYAPLNTNGLLAICKVANENYQILASRELDKEEIYQYQTKRGKQILKIFEKHGIDRDEYFKEVFKILIENEIKDIFYPENFINLRKELDSYATSLEKLLKINSDRCEWNFYTGLHVHHTYYKFDTLPWEYPNEALTTLCWICHENEHKDSEMPILNENGIEIDKLPLCKRCYGAGYLPQYNYHQGGKCFRCNGYKFEIEGLNKLNSIKGFK
jgi:hypothetical protein